MNSQVMLGAIAVFGLAVGATASAADAGADTGSDGGLYLGASIGQASISVDDVDFDEDDSGFKIFGGYSFNRHFALELAYVDSGTPTLSGGGASVEVSASALVLSAVGRIPVNDSIAFFGKLGLASHDSEITARYGALSFSGEESGSDIAYGVGMSAALGQNFELRFEYENIDLDGAEFSMISVGGAIKF